MVWSWKDFHEFCCQLQNTCMVPVIFNEMQDDNHKIYSLFNFTQRKGKCEP